MDTKSNERFTAALIPNENILHYTKGFFFPLCVKIAGLDTSDLNRPRKELQWVKQKARKVLTAAHEGGHTYTGEGKYSSEQ